MYQLEFDLRPSLTVQYELPFDYTGCDTRYDNIRSIAWSNSYLVCTGSSVGWQPVPNTSIIIADEVIVKKPLKSLWSNIKHWIKR